MSDTTITRVHGRRVWDSRGRPTVEVDVRLAGGAAGRAIAPAGASRGSNEAVDLRDGGQAHGGMGVATAVAHVNGDISRRLVGSDALDQAAIDGDLVALDGTPARSRLGGNAMIATSMAVLHAAAASHGMALYAYLAQTGHVRLPLPEVQIFGGGAHAGRRTDIQDFMVMPLGAHSFDEALVMTAEVYRAAGELMTEAGTLYGVADEGGFWPAFDSNEQALTMVVRAIERAGYRPLEDIGISLDVAASEFGSEGRYRLGLDGRELDTDGMCELLLSWIGRYPIVSIEDPLAEDDAAGMRRFTAAAGTRIQIIGDDFLVTNAQRVTDAAVLGRLQRGADQAESSRHHHRDTGRARCGQTCRVGDHHLRPLRRDRGRHDRSPRGRLGCRPAQSRLVRPFRAHGEVERGAAHRGGAGRGGAVCRARRTAATALKNNP